MKPTMRTRRSALRLMAGAGVFAPAVVRAVAQTRYKIKVINTASNTSRRFRNWSASLDISTSSASTSKR